MAVILFRAGGGYVSNGIKCEMCIANEHSYLHLLDKGWKYSAEECYATEKPPEAEEAEAESEPEPELEAEPETSLQDLRQAAKDAGIEKWQVKGMKRLVKELDELED